MSSACTGTGASRKWQPGSSLAAGLYYANCNIVLSGSNRTTRATFVSEGTVKVSGSNGTWDAFTGGLVFVSGASGAASIQVNASNSTINGTSFATGTFELPGSNNRLTCGVAADKVRIGGSNNRVTGDTCNR